MIHHPSGLRVREIGEFALIQRLAAQLPASVGASSAVPVGIGDDAAVWQPGDGRDLVITTDALVEGVHFDLGWTDWYSLGHKMLAVNVSDLAAMGAQPRLATIVLGLTGNELVPDLEMLYRGAASLAEPYGLVIAGGDVVRAPHDLTISVTAIGEVERGSAVRRDGARAGDLVVVSGTLGASAAGLRLLMDGNAPNAATAPLLIAAHLRPVPRVALGRLMRPAGVSAAMDLSDGLFGDLRKIMDASGVSAELDMAALPVLPAVRALFPDHWLELATRGGEDYELLMTVPPDRFDDLQRDAADIDATVTAIGRMTRAPGPPELFLVRDGERVAERSEAFDHFAH